VPAAQVAQSGVVAVQADMFIMPNMLYNQVVIYQSKLAKAEHIIQVGTIKLAVILLVFHAQTAKAETKVNQVILAQL
jgi:hypothetical protein